MSEENGNRDLRFDRMERVLELLIADHEQFRQDHKQLLTAQVLQKESIDDLLKITQEHTRQIEKQGLHIEEQGRQFRERSEAIDRRIERLISSIGEFIRRTQP